MQHLDEGTIHAWLDGALKPDEAAEVEQHVADCATCSAGVAEARGFIAASSRILSALNDVPSVGKREAARAPTTVATERQLPRRRSRFPLYAAAATLFLAVGTVTLSRLAADGDRLASSVADSAMPSVAQKPDQAVAPTPARDVAAESSPVPTPAPSMTVGPRAEPRVALERSSESQAAKTTAPMRKAASERDEAAVANVAAADTSAVRARADIVAAAAPPAPAGASMRARERADSARTDSLLRRQAIALEQVVTTGAAASAARGGGVAQMRTLVAMPADVQGFAARGRPVRYAGCYAVVRTDGDDREREERRESRVLPLRLALDSSGSSLADAARSSARPAGGDSLGVVSAAWRQVAPNQVEVRWTVADGSSFVLLAEDAGGVLRGTVTSSARQPLFTERVELRRVAC